MAAEIRVPGWCKVSVQQSSGTLATLTELGRTRNGVTVSFEHFWLDVPGDEFGGDDGPPIDAQFLGSVARIRCEFTKYDIDVLYAALGLLRGSDFGEMGVQGSSEKYPGKLIFSPVNYTRVLLQPQIEQTRNFPRCFIRAPHEQNLATKYASPIVEFEAHVHDFGSGVLAVHNTSTSATFPGA